MNYHYHCTQGSSDPDGRVSAEYSISVDDKGNLLSVDGAEAISEGNNKYKVGRQTFWFYADSKRLRRYDAAVGNVYWNCK